MKKHLAATALICLLPSAFAQTLYKCGNSYQQTYRRLPQQNRAGGLQDDLAI